MPTAWCRTCNCSSVTSKYCGLIIGKMTIQTRFPATWSQSTAYPVYLESILILSSHLCLGPPSDPTPSASPKKPMYIFSLIHAMYPAHLIILWIRSCAADSGTALQARRLQVWFSMGLLDLSTWSFWLYYASGVDSESQRNEYQKYLLEGKGSHCVGLTTLPP